MQLTTNFSVKGMCRSYTAQRLGIDNTPNEQQIKNLIYFCEQIAQPCRDKFGRIDVNSGFRCKALNDAIGSSDRSFHPQACAGDLEPHSKDVSNFELLLYIYENCEFTELIAEYFDKDDKEAGWVHAAIKKGDGRKMLKLKDEQHNYQVVTIEYLKELYG